MVATISTDVYGGRTKRFWRVWLIHAIAATLAAGAFGSLFGAIGALLGAPWGTAGLAIVIAAGFVYALRDLIGLKLPLPDLKNQVPEWWRTYFSPEVTSALYGVGLGSAFFTSLRYGTYVVVSAAAIASGDPVVGAVVCAPFGIGRAVSLLITRLDEADESVSHRLVARANGTASGLVALGLALALFA